MKRIVLTILLLAGIAVGVQPLLLAGPNKIKNHKVSPGSTEERKVSGFTKIEISGAFEVRLIKSNTYSLKVEADESDMGRIKTEVSGDKLIIKYEKEGKSYEKNSSKKFITIQTPTLTALTCSGAVEIKSSDIFETEKFDLKTSGATEVELGIKAKLLISKPRRCLYSGALRQRHVIPAVFRAKSGARCV